MQKADDNITNAWVEFQETLHVLQSKQLKALTDFEERASSQAMKDAKDHLDQIDV
jgi:hypothetical protein